MKKIMFVFLAIALMVFPVSAFAAGAYDSLDAVVLKGADNSSVGAAAALFGELVTKKVSEITGGKLTVEYYANSVQGNDQEIQGLMLAGDLDFVICQTAPTVSFVPEAAIFDLPMAFAKYDAATIDKALNNSAFTEKLNAAYKAKGMNCLHFLQGATFRETTSNKPIRAVADFNGLKIRTMENVNHMAFWSGMGANPTPLPWSEVYLALQQGLIEAQENATDTSWGNNMHDVQKYLIPTHHILYANQFLINNARFESLDPAYQAALTQAVKESAKEIEAQLADIDASNRENLIKGGMELITLDAAVIDEIVQKSAPIYDSIGEQIGAELVKSLQDELAAAAK